MTAVTYIVTVYLMTCAVMYAVLRVSISDKTLRLTFLVIGLLAPIFAVQIFYRALTSSNEPSPEEQKQMLAAANEIEQIRLKTFGGKQSLPAKLQLEYVRTLDKTAERVERMVEKLSA